MLVYDKEANVRRVLVRGRAGDQGGCGDGGGGEGADEAIAHEWTP